MATGFFDGQGSTAVQLAAALAVARRRRCWRRCSAPRAGGWQLAALAGGCFLYLALFGQWASAMTTLASIVVAVPLGVAGGMLLGIAAYR